MFAMHRSMRKLDALEKIEQINIAACGNDGYSSKYYDGLKEFYENRIVALELESPKVKEKSNLREITDEERKETNKSLFRILAIKRRTHGV